MNRSLPALTYVLIAVHTTAAVGAAIAGGPTETGTDRAAFVAAVSLVAAATWIAGAARLPSIRIGGITAIALFAALFASTCSPLMRHAGPIAAAQRFTCGTPFAGLLVVPFLAPVFFSRFASAVARRRHLSAIRFCAAFVALAAIVASVLVMTRVPHGALPVSEWIRAQPVMASAPAITGQQTEAGRDSIALDHFLWLHRVCFRHECQLTLSRQPEATEQYVESSFGARGAATLSGDHGLQVRFLAPIERWYVESTGTGGEYRDAVAFDAATWEPMPLYAQDLRRHAGPMRANDILAFASPLLAFLVYWLARRRVAELPDITRAIEQLHLGAGVLDRHDTAGCLPPRIDAHVASLRELPPGPVVIEFERVPAAPFREVDTSVRRIFPGSIEHWRHEHAVARTIPWFAAGVVAFCAVSGLVAWMR